MVKQKKSSVKAEVSPNILISLGLISSLLYALVVAFGDLNYKLSAYAIQNSPTFFATPSGEWLLRLLIHLVIIVTASIAARGVYFQVRQSNGRSMWGRDAAMAAAGIFFLCFFGFIVLEFALNWHYHYA